MNKLKNKEINLKSKITFLSLKITNLRVLYNPKRQKLKLSNQSNKETLKLFKDLKTQFFNSQPF